MVYFIDSMTSANPLHVIVVGAGPGGLMAAYRLQSNGIRVTVIEKCPLEQLCADVGGAYDISGNSKKIFEAVGLGEEFNSLGGVIKGFTMINSQDGSVFKDAQIGEGFLAGLRRSEIQQTLVNALEEDCLICGSGLAFYEENDDEIKGAE